jgi:DNA-binding response OmpR family regulator
VSDEIPRQAPAADEGHRPPRILLLDPDRRFARLLGSYLVAQGWQAKYMEDPRQALARLEKLQADLICIELVGPEPAGFDFVALLRRVPNPPPVVICTRFAAAASWDPETLCRLGVRALVARPNSFVEMDAVFRGCLAPHRQRCFPAEAEQGGVA